MERALIAHSEIEQGIRFGARARSVRALFRAAGRPGDRRGHRLRGARPLDPPVDRDHLPDTFIPVAEEIGLIGRLVRKSHRAPRLPKRRDGTRRSSISVNISPVAAGRPLACAEDRAAADRNRLSRPTGWWSRSPKAPCSPTWTWRGRSSPASRTRASGWRSTISAPAFRRSSHLRSLPFDVIKIDRSFVATIHRDTRKRGDRPRRDDACQCARRPGDASRASRTRPTHAAVLGFGCAVGQGWYFGKPMTGRPGRRNLLADRAQAAAPATRPRAASG